MVKVFIITEDDLKDLRLCVECAFLQTKDYALHQIAKKLLKKLRKTEVGGSEETMRLAKINNDLALKHSIQLEKLARKIKQLELLIDSQAQTNDEFHLRLTKLEDQKDG